MQARDLILEDTLLQYIENDNFEGFLRLFRMMKENCPESTYFHEQYQKSFLQIALEKKAGKIAEELIERSRFNEDVLYAQDSEGRTLLHIAIINENFSAAKRLVSLAKDNKKIESYLTSDSSGSTVFHYAAQIRDIETREQTLGLLLSLSESKKIINIKNNKNEVVLDYSLKNNSITTVILLINNGAQIINIFLFSRLDIEIQAKLFNLCDENQKKLVLTLYSEFLDEKLLKDVNNQNINSIQNNLFTLAGLLNLKTYMLYYHKYHRNEFEKCFEALSDSEEETYKQKIEETISTLYQQTLINPVDLQIYESEDVKKLNQLIKIQNDFLDELEDRMEGKKNSEKCLKIRNAYWIAYAMLYIGIEIYCIADAIKNPQPQRPSAGIPIIVGFVGLIGFCLGFFLNARDSLFRSESEPLLDQLEEELLKPLQEIEKKDALESTNDLPTDPQNLRKIETEISDLKDDKWDFWTLNRNPFWQSNSLVYNDLTVIRKMTNKIRNDVIKTGKSITPKKDEVRIVDMDNNDVFIDMSSSSEDSYVPLSIFSSTDKSDFIILEDDESRVLLKPAYSGSEESI